MLHMETGFYFLRFLILKRVLFPVCVINVTQNDEFLRSSNEYLNIRLPKHTMTSIYIDRNNRGQIT